MSALRGLLVGTLAVAALDAVVTSRQASDRVGGLAGDVGRAIDRLVSPDIPAIGPAGSPSATGAAATTGPTIVPAAAAAGPRQTTPTLHAVNALTTTKAAPPRPIVKSV